MGTIEEVEESLAKQVKRHELLKLIITKLDEMDETDDEGRQWILEQLAEG